MKNLILSSVLALVTAPVFASANVDMAGKLVLIDQVSGQIHNVEIKSDATAVFTYALRGVATSIECTGVAEPLTKAYGSGVSLNMLCGVDQEATAIEILVKSDEQQFFDDGKLATSRLTIVNDGFPVTNHELDIKRTSK